MTDPRTAEGEKNAEIIRLTVGIPGVGRAHRSLERRGRVVRVDLLNWR